MFKVVSKVFKAIDNKFITRYKPYLINNNNYLGLTKITKKNILSGTNSRYIEEMHKAWSKNPESVHISWKTYFENLNKNKSEDGFVVPPNLDPMSNVKFTATPSSKIGITNDLTKIAQLIRVYQKNGYLKATTDPLRIMENLEKFPILKNMKDLSYKNNGFTEEDLEREFYLPENNIKKGLLGPGTTGRIKLKDLINKLEKAYCSDIGVEFKHITNREETNFIIDYMENKWVEYNGTKESKIEAYRNIARAAIFESFLDKKFQTKRFGLEGLETMISGLQTYFEVLSNHGVKDITLGMAHRGRLNVLANVFGKPYIKIFKEMLGKMKDSEGDEYSRTGDVKYHLGHSQTKKLNNGKQLTMEILPNPSHLECVNPVVQGKVRAKQHYNKDDQKES